jgi:hypothetical protein
VFYHRNYVSFLGFKSVATLSDVLDEALLFALGPGGFAERRQLRVKQFGREGTGESFDCFALLGGERGETFGGTG